MQHNLPLALLDTVPNPILVKDDQLRYVWVNHAFEELFNIRCEDLVGRVDSDVFTQRQSAQCNGGDLRVLASGEVDEAEETVVNASGEHRETLTRKSRLELDGCVYLVGVMHDITALCQANQLLRQQSIELEILAAIDPLTGCLNRRSFFERWRELPEDDAGHIVLMIDADNFKAVNDAYGHEVGDRALVKITQAMNDALPDGSLLARFGGEEFVVGLPACDREQGAEIANQIREAVERTLIDTEQGTFSVSVSIGIAHARGTSQKVLDSALRTADRGLLHAKAQGRNMAIAA